MYREDRGAVIYSKTGDIIIRRADRPISAGSPMASCPWCGTDLYGYSKSIPEKTSRGKKVTGVACCPWCKWSGTGEQFIDLDDDDVRIPYWPRL